GFQLLVRLTNADWTRAAAADDVHDLRFISDGTPSPLPYDLDTLDNDQVLVWVRLPMLAAAPAAMPRLWAYYGNPDVGAGAQPNEVWAGQLTVHHLTGLNNSTSSSYNANTPAGVEVPPVGPGA